jgi:hypothetical protein
MFNPVRYTQSAQCLQYDWNKCGSSHTLHDFCYVDHWLADGERRQERRVCFTQRAWEGKELFFFWKGSTRDAEVTLESGDAHRGDVDSEERSTDGGNQSNVNFTGVHLEGTGSAHAGYNCAERTRRIQRSSTVDRHK